MFLGTVFLMEFTMSQKVNALVILIAVAKCITEKLYQFAPDEQEMVPMTPLHPTASSGQGVVKVLTWAVVFSEEWYLMHCLPFLTSSGLTFVVKTSALKSSSVPAFEICKRKQRAR